MMVPNLLHVAQDRLASFSSCKTAMSIFQLEAVGMLTTASGRLESN